MWLIVWLLIGGGLAASAQAATFGVTTTGSGCQAANSSLQTCLSSASVQPGDTIEVADGNYTALYTINGTAGTSGAKITLKAQNRHGAVFQGTGACNMNNALTMAEPWWIVEGFRFEDNGRAIFLNANNLEIRHNIVEHYMGEGISSAQFTGLQGANIHHNVVALGDTVCAGNGDAVAIWLDGNADNNTVADNIVYGTGNNASQFSGGHTGYGMLISNNSDNNTQQGNLFMFNQGKGITRILSDAPGETADHNLVRDNAVLWGEGGPISSDDCSEDSNTFLNNLIIGNYHSGFGTKGQATTGGPYGHHIIRHNTWILSPLQREGASIGTSIGTPSCSANDGKKIDNTFQDNLMYSPDNTNAGSGAHVLFTVADQAYSIDVSSHNLFWSPSSRTGPNTWTAGYTFQGTDVATAGTPGRPIFTNEAAGDFSLAASSPVGRGDASDSTDRGMTFNSALKKAWVMNAFALPTQQQATTGTSHSFNVTNNRTYAIWFFIPTSPCSSSAEQFTVEGATANRVRNISGLHADATWIQPGGQARWITLGRQLVTDGTLNILWQNATCVGELMIKQLPTVDEAYSWITASEASGVPAAPTNLRVVNP